VVWFQTDLEYPCEGGSKLYFKTHQQSGNHNEENESKANTCSSHGRHRFFLSFSMLSPVCLTPAVNRAVVKEVEKLHFKALQVVVFDYKQRLSRNTISCKTQRLPPKNYGCALLLPHSWWNYRIAGYPANLRTKAFANTCSKNRRIGLLIGYDDSTYKIGKQMTIRTGVEVL